MVGITLSFIQRLILILQSTFLNSRISVYFRGYTRNPPRDNSESIQKNMAVLSYQEKFTYVALLVATGRHMLIIIMVLPTTSTIFVKGMYNLHQ